MQVEVMDKYINKRVTPFDLSFRQWLQLKITGKVYVFDLQLKNWKGYLPFYIFKCPNCKKLSLNYPQGYGEYLYCNNHKTIILDNEPVHIVVSEPLEASA